MSLATLQLKTVAVLPEGCFGVLTNFVGVPFAVTLERTFENLRVVIPNGVHRCTRSQFYRGGYPTFEVHVEGHSRLLFHRGNIETDSEGCIIVAEEFGKLSNRPAVLDSRGGFDEWWDLVKDRAEFFLDVSGR